MFRKQQVLGALAWLCLTSVGSSSLQAEMVTVYPVEASGPLSNPLMGFRPNLDIIVMDSNKSISANYVPVPVYTLTTNATRGSVSLNPPGGVYNAGTAVTVTATPSTG